MALVRCPECQREVSDSAVQCPGCGFSVKEHFEREARYRQYEEEAHAEAYQYVKELERKRIESERAAEAERIKRIREEEERILKEKQEAEEKELRRIRSKKNFKYKVLTLIVIVVGAYGLHYYNQNIVPEKTYKSAIECMENQNYEKAIGMLENIADRKEVSEFLNESKYLFAEQVIENESDIYYMRANNYLEELGDYKESKKMIKWFEQEKIRDGAIYKRAVELLEDGDYSGAIDLFKKSEINMSDRNFSKAYIGLGNKYFSKGDYQNAVYYFDLVSDVEETFEEYQELCYNLGMFSYDRLMFDKASDYFERIPEYKNSTELLNSIKDKKTEVFSVEDEFKELLDGYWYKAIDTTSGAVLLLDTMGEFAYGDFEDIPYVESAKEVKDKYNLDNFFIDIRGVRTAHYLLKNEGDNEYSFVIANEDDFGYRTLLTFKVDGKQINVTDTYFAWWEFDKAVTGLYTKVQ